MSPRKFSRTLDFIFLEREAADSGRGGTCGVLNVEADQAQDRPDQARREAKSILL